LKKVTPIGLEATVEEGNAHRGPKNVMNSSIDFATTKLQMSKQNLEKKPTIIPQVAAPVQKLGIVDRNAISPKHTSLIINSHISLRQPEHWLQFGGKSKTSKGYPECHWEPAAAIFASILPPSSKLHPRKKAPMIHPLINIQKTSKRL
jgi:hypothetical protein